MAYGIMANEELMVLSTNSSFTLLCEIGMEQCMKATIAKDHIPWCMMQPDMGHGKKFTE
jgi:hypothetical protein